MYLADSHTHSSCSPDGSFPMREMVRGALRAGISDLCITDHFDMISLDGSERIKSHDWEPALLQWEEMKRAYGDRLELPLGIEFGMAQIDPACAAAILSQPALDFVIGAIHNFSEEMGGRDFYFTDYETVGDCYRALDNYFASMALLARMEVYDVLAHVFYPLRYMIRPSYALPELTRYTDQLREIFTAVAQAGKGIELNTWKGKTLGEWKPILQLYRACGGEIVTVGSDAHDPDAIGLGVREAYELLKDSGFRYVASYRQRKPQFIKL